MKRWAIAAAFSASLALLTFFLSGMNVGALVSDPNGRWILWLILLGFVGLTILFEGAQRHDD